MSGLWLGYKFDFSENKKKNKIYTAQQGIE